MHPKFAALLRFPNFEAIAFLFFAFCAYCSYFLFHSASLTSAFFFLMLACIPCLIYRGLLTVLRVRNTVIRLLPGLVVIVVGLVAWFRIQYGIGTALVLPTGIGMTVGGAMSRYA